MRRATVAAVRLILTRLEALIVVIGATFLVAAIAAYDWRAGLGAAGLALLASVIDFGAWRRSI